MATLQQMLARFGFVTVMNPTFYEVGTSNVLFSIDSLRISNITQEGPTKTVKGGLYANTQMRYGKTMRLEMEDVVGRIEVLTELMGAKYSSAAAPTTVVETFTAIAGQTIFAVSRTAASVVSVELNNGDLDVTDDYTVNGSEVTLVVAASAGDSIRITYTVAPASEEKLQITDKFSPAVKIIGRTFVIDSATGNKSWVNIHIPNFLPDSVFEQTMEAEGDFGAMNIAGDILANECGVFYEFLVGDQEPTNC